MQGSLIKIYESKKDLTFFDYKMCYLLKKIESNCWFIKMPTVVFLYLTKILGNILLFYRYIRSK